MSYDKRSALDEFTTWSRSYDRSILQILLFRPSHRWLLRELRRHADTQADRELRVLDIGCGTGVLAAKIVRRFPGARVWGIDLCRPMLEHAGRRRVSLGQPFTLVQGDSEKLPFASGSFDVVTCAHSFHHYPRQQRAVHEMNRVLKPGGRLMIIDGYRDLAWGRLIFDVCVVAVEGQVRHPSARKFRTLLERAGFQAIRQRIKFGLAPFILTVGRKLPAPGSSGRWHHAIRFWGRLTGRHRQPSGGEARKAAAEALDQLTNHA